MLFIILFISLMSFSVFLSFPVHFLMDGRICVPVFAMRSWSAVIPNWAPYAVMPPTCSTSSWRQLWVQWQEVLCPHTPAGKRGIREYGGSNKCQKCQSNIFFYNYKSSCYPLGDLMRPPSGSWGHWLRTTDQRALCNLESILAFFFLFYLKNTIWLKYLPFYLK